MDAWIDALRTPAGRRLLEHASGLALTDATLLADLCGCWTRCRGA